MTTENPYLKYFSPLEMLALAELPEEARVQRLASIMIRKEMPFIYNPTQAGAKLVIAAVGEPRGRKGWLAKKLPEAVLAQQRVRYRRLGVDGRDKHGLMNAQYICEYQPVDLPSGTGSAARDRKRNIRLSRFYRLIGDKLETLLPEIGYPPFRLKNKRTYQAWEIGVPDYYDGGMLTVYTAHERYANGSRWRRKSIAGPPHKFLVWTDGETVKLIRARKGVRNAASAIESLKGAAVRKADKVGDVVRLDIRNEKFLVRNPKRRKWREVPFKRHSRG